MPDDRNINKVIQHNNRRYHRNQQPQVEKQSHQRFLSPHEPSRHDRFPQPASLPSHLLFQEHFMPVRHNGGADRGILIICPVMPYDKVCQAPVVSESCLLAQEFLMQPVIRHFTDCGKPVAAQRTAQAHDRIEIRLCRFHHPEGYIVPDALHLCQVVCIGVCHICPPGYSAHLRILHRLNQVPDGVRFQEGVRIHKCDQFRICVSDPDAHGFALPLVVLLKEYPDSLFQSETFSFRAKGSDCFLNHFR